MRLGNKKYVCMRRRSIHRGKVTFFLCLVLLIMIISYFFCFFLQTVRPVMIDLAKTRAHNIATMAINHVVIDVFTKGEADYSDVLVLQKDAEGKITAVQSNLEGINKLKAVITTKVQDYIKSAESTEISVPLGVFFGNDIFAGVGPKVKIEMMPYGICEIDFESEFTDSGINQTNLSIDLKATTEMALVMPTVRTNTEVTTHIPVVKTIIVGDVPGSYTNVDREGMGYEDDVLQLSE